MKMTDKAVLITGANRGIGRAVEEMLNRGAGRVYAAARQPFIHSDERVTPLSLDVTDAAQNQAVGGKTYGSRRMFRVAISMPTTQSSALSDAKPRQFLSLFRS